MPSLWFNKLKPVRTRNVLLLLLACTVTACTDPSFKNEQAFATYVAELDLSGLSLPAAISRVTAQGFSCYPEKNNHYCVREEKGMICNKKQVIIFPLAETDQNPLKISTKFWLVCL